MGSIWASITSGFENFSIGGLIHEIVSVFVPLGVMVILVMAFNEIPGLGLMNPLNMGVLFWLAFGAISFLFSGVTSMITGKF